MTSLDYPKFVEETHSVNRHNVHNNNISYSEYDCLRCKRKPRKKTSNETLWKTLIVLVVGFFLFRYVMPSSCSFILHSIFVPNPHKNIKYEFRYPTADYLNNNLVLGRHLFSFAAEKKQGMEKLKENVNMPVLRSGLISLMENYPDLKPSIYVWDYETQNYVSINASKTYPTASIIKIPVLIDVFKSIENNQFSLEDKMALTEIFRTEGSGNLQFHARNSKYTIDELANRMIIDSDNSATNMLISKVGSMQDVNSQIRAWGLNNTEINTWLPDYRGTNFSTAKDIATMLYNIDYNDKFLSEFSRSKMLNYMGHVHNNQLAQAGLGEGSVFLHKTGDIGQMLGDAGIVISPNGIKYIMVILVKRPHNSFAAKEFIVNASRIIYDYMVR